MFLDRYRVTSVKESTTYEFFSEGPKGRIRKIVKYQHAGGELYNLAFGDWDDENKRINDVVRTNNNDRDKILATVASTAIEFFKTRPDAIIFLYGETPAKTRLYQMGLNRFLIQINELFLVQGIMNGDIVPFLPGNNYEGFTVEARQII